MRQRINFDRIPRRRVVLQFEFRGVAKRTYWLVIEPPAASVCLKNPRFDIDLIVSADIWAFYQVWLGRWTLAEAMRRGKTKLDGAPADVRGFAHWFALSPMAEALRAALADRETESGKLSGRGNRGLTRGTSTRHFPETRAHS